MRNQILKRVIVAAAGFFLFSAGFYFFWLAPRYTVPILTYHRFDEGRGAYSVSPENFERQMRYLKNAGFHVISLDALVTGIKNNKRFSHRTVVITIDDGSRDNFTRAYPVLKKYGIPATMFLITNRIGSSGTTLDWDAVVEMFRNNISFGGHTKNHVCLPFISKEDVLWDEIAGCKKVIEEHTGVPADYFCYPFGWSTGKAEEIVRRAGYKGACVTSHGRDRWNRNNVYELNRISPGNGDPAFSFSNLVFPVKFRAKISGYSHE